MSVPAIYLISGKSLQLMKGKKKVYERKNFIGLVKHFSNFTDKLFGAVNFEFCPGNLVSEAKLR